MESNRTGSPLHPPKRNGDLKGSPSSLPKPNQVSTVFLYGIPIVSLFIEGQERLCLAQISNTLLKQFSYNEIHNRRVALGITCVQCTPVQLEILRRAGAMPVSSRRCGMITRREAERLCKSFLGDNSPPRLPDDFAFSVHHECAWGCRGSFLPSRYNSSRAKCIKCAYCGLFFSPNKFIFHSHRLGPGDKYVQPDAANFNSWRRHMKLTGSPPEEISFAWEDVKAMFNGGTRKRMLSSPPSSVSNPKRLKESETPLTSSGTTQYPIRPRVNIHPTPNTAANPPRIPNFPTDLPLPFPRSLMMDYMWHAQTSKSNSLQFPPYALPWLKRPGSLIFNGSAAAAAAETPSAASPSAAHASVASTEPKSLHFYNNSAFKPVINSSNPIKLNGSGGTPTVAPTYVSDDEQTVATPESQHKEAIKECLSESEDEDEVVDIETTEDDDVQPCGSPPVLERPARTSPGGGGIGSVVEELKLVDRNSNLPLESAERSPRQSPSMEPTRPGELWSVARLSLDRREAPPTAAAAAAAASRLPFYRNDLVKHFQHFRHGESPHPIV